MLSVCFGIAHLYPILGTGLQVSDDELAGVMANAVFAQDLVDLVFLGLGLGFDFGLLALLLGDEVVSFRH
jgi:hypothetical protein